MVFMISQTLRSTLVAIGVVSEHFLYITLPFHSLIDGISAYTHTQYLAMYTNPTTVTTGPESTSSEVLPLAIMPYRRSNPTNYWRSSSMPNPYRHYRSPAQAEGKV